MKKTPVPTNTELLGPILDAVNSSIQQNVVAALEPVINNQNQSESRVNNQLSVLEAHVATLSQVLNQSRRNQEFKCDLCGRTFQNQRSLQNHTRTDHKPSPT